MKDGLGRRKVLSYIAVGFPVVVLVAALLSLSPFTNFSQCGQALTSAAAAARAGGSGLHTGHFNSTALTCTPAEAVLQQSHFAEHLALLRYYSACGANAWLRQLYRLDPQTPRTFMDLGCNKGYESASFFRLWASQLNMTKERIFKFHEERGSGDPCGACNDCHTEELPGDPQLLTPVAVHCFEPSTHHYDKLIELRGLFPELSDENSQARWHILNQACTNFTGSMPFDTSCDNELCGQEADEPSGTIPTTTVSDYLDGQGIGAVDVLKIDTEGRELAVLEGAWRHLQAGKITIVYFEYNDTWRPVGRLQDAVADLEAAGYACYLEGRPTLTKLTHGCWVPEYEFFAWSNVVCVRSDHEMHRRLDEISFLRGIV